MQTFVVLAALIVVTGFSLNVTGAITQQTTPREIVFPTTIQWNKQKGVIRYRLQIAGDENFRNVFTDRLVTGARYDASNLSPGYYYWRVAPADLRSSGFSRPVRFFVSGGVVMPVRVSNRAAGARKLPATGEAVRSRRRF